MRPVTRFALPDTEDLLEPSHRCGPSWLLALQLCLTFLPAFSACTSPCSLQLFGGQLQMASTMTPLPIGQLSGRHVTLPVSTRKAGCKGHPCPQDCDSSVMISAYGYGNETALINDPAPDPMSGAAQDADHLCTCVFVPAWIGNWPFMLVARIRPGGQPHALADLSVKQVGFMTNGCFLGCTLWCMGAACATQGIGT